MTTKKNKIIAIVAIRNGAYYFNKLCNHLRENGISIAVIDNDSEDNIQDLIRINSDIVETVHRLPYKGAFDLTEQLEFKQTLVSKFDTDWIIHLDVDELLYSNIPGETLQDAINRIDSKGFNAINFDEFVFLPIPSLKYFHARNFHQMRWYYFFEPRKRRLVRAYKSMLRTEVKSGGHGVEGTANIYPQNMILRHYMFQNQTHAKVKYRERLYSKQDLENNFHGNRKVLQKNKLLLPKKKNLIKASKNQWGLDTSEPKTTHFWSW